jgi:phenylalanyl-tRNA synthetase alpha chain
VSQAEKLLEEVERAVVAATAAVREASSRQELDSLAQVHLGRRSLLARAFKTLGSLPEGERRQVGLRLNALRRKLEEEVAARRAALDAAEEAARVRGERADLTLPGRWPKVGRPHPIGEILQEVTEFFLGLGFRVAEGPEVELDWYNFEALNMPPEHPARSLWDTFYLDLPPAGSLLMRTHTSPVQIRVMEAEGPPVRVIAPGRTYRHDTPDASHSPVFHQVEGLYVDRDVSFADLKGTVEEFVRSLFGTGARARFRASYFPFTEPSAEVDVSCASCAGAGCRTCGQKGWLEIMGAGMVHPAVFRAVGYDPEEVSGFAFGMGVERIAMLRYGVDDIRAFYEGDVEFLGRLGGVE